MFILPANNRPNALTSALQGLSQSSSIIHQRAKERVQEQKKQQQELEKSRIGQLLQNNPQAFQNPDLIINAVRSGALPEKIGIAALNNIAAYQRENAPYLPSAAAQSNAAMPTNAGVPNVNVPNAGVPGQPQGYATDNTATPASQRDYFNQQPSSTPPSANAQANAQAPLQYREAPSAQEIQRSGVSKKGHEINETQRKEQNERYLHYEKENAPIRQQAAASITTGDKLLSAGLKLQELNKRGNLGGKFTTVTDLIAKTIGIDPLVFLSDDEQAFNKEVANLLPTYLRNSYTGRILLSEVEEQRKGIVQSKNSPEARQKLIEAIINLGRNAVEAGKDYERVTKQYGKADPMLLEHLQELAENRFMKENGDKTVRVKGADGHMYDIPYRELQEFEESQLDLQSSGR